MLAQLLELSTALIVLTTLVLVAFPARFLRPYWADGGATLLALGAAAGLTAVLSNDVAGACAVLAIVATVFIGVRAAARSWQAMGCALFTGVGVSAAAYLVYVGLLTFGGSLGLVGAIISVVLLVLEVAALGLTMTYIHELVDVMARRDWHHVSHPVPLSVNPPCVCIQVPAYNEPVELLRATLDALVNLDYPNYMVQLVDNNTSDPALWEPIRDHCQKLGRRFHFIHLEDWPGYKSGALNEATRRLPASVEIVAVVDADYVVEPTFLTDTVGQFLDPSVAFVQTPQHYREWADDAYMSHCFYAYKYFFDVTMPSRQQRNAIIFGGTMGLIRRSVLDGIGGWDEWCITEDAEASLRILAEGYRGVFINKAYGHGLMPLTFDGLKKQRFRWAFGGIQILKKHWRLMLTGRRPEGSRSKLTRAQRYHYLAGSLQWFNELLTVAFTVLLLVSGAVILLGHHLPIRQLTGALLAIPILFILAGLLRVVWALRVRSGAGTRQALGALGVLFSLSWVVAQACVLALMRRRGVFLRTPKARSGSSLVRSVTATRSETVVSLVALAVGLSVLMLRPGAISLGLALLTLTQAALYLNAPINALRAEGIQGTPLRLVFRRSPQNTGQRPVAVARQARKAVLSAALALAASAFVAAIATAPEGASILSPGSLLPSVGGIAGGLRGPTSSPPTKIVSPSPSSPARANGSSAVPTAGGTAFAVGGGSSANPLPGGVASPAPGSNPGRGITPSPASSPGRAPTSAPTSRPTGGPSSAATSHPTPSPRRP